MVLAITQLRIERFTALQMKLFMLSCRSLQENESCIDLLTVWKLVQICNSPLHNLISHSNCNLNIHFHLIIALTATRVVAYFLSFSPVILSHEAVDCLAEETDHAIKVAIPHPSATSHIPAYFPSRLFIPWFWNFKNLGWAESPF